MSITVADVKAGFSTTVPDAEIQMVIDFVDGADACLTANSVPVNTQDLLKLYAVRHLLWTQSNDGKGSITSQSAPSGASQSYGKWQGQGSPYWDNLARMDISGCIRSLIDSKNRMYLAVVG